MDDLKVNARQNLIFKENIPQNDSNFFEYFIALSDSAGNIYYCLKKEYDELKNNFNGNWQSELLEFFPLENYFFLSGIRINLPIPSNAMIKKSDGKYELIEFNAKKYREAISCLTYLSPNVNTDYSGFIHADVYGMTGTNCTTRIAATKFQPFFKIENIGDFIMPLPKNNGQYEDLVRPYTEKNELFLSPLITPIYTIIYVISDDEAKLDKFINMDTGNIEFGIALDGDIIPIDDWDASVYFLK